MKPLTLPICVPACNDNKQLVWVIFLYVSGSWGGVGGCGCVCVGGGGSVCVGGETYFFLCFFFFFVFVFIHRHTIVARYYGFTLDVRVSVRASVRPSYARPTVRFSFPDDNLSKHQWIFTKFCMCIDIVEIWFAIANGQISSIFYGVICLRHAHIFISGR